jgi:hypothetical protein
MAKLISQLTGLFMKDGDRIQASLLAFAIFSSTIAGIYVLVNDGWFDFILGEDTPSAADNESKVTAGNNTGNGGCDTAITATGDDTIVVNCSQTGDIQIGDK